MELRSKSVFLTLVLATFSSGCVNVANVARKEIDAKENIQVETYSGALTYGRNLAEEYLDLSSRGNYVDDGFFIVLLGLAASTALQTVKGADATELSRIGIAAVTVNEGSKYVANGAAVSHLLDAAEQTACLVRKGEAKRVVLEPDLGFSTKAASLILNGLQTVRISLRKKLLKQTPDFAALAKTLAAAIVEEKSTAEEAAASNAVRANEIGVASLAQKRAAEQVLRKKALAELGKEVADCVLKSK